MYFRDVIGQDELKQHLIDTVKENRISHTQLFIGPEGSGKLTMALAYARYINCLDRNDNDACGVCPSCVKFDKLAHPDLQFIYPVANTTVAEGLKSNSKPQSKNFITAWRELNEERKGYIALKDWYEKIRIENKQGIINAEDCNEVIKAFSYSSFESEYAVMIVWMAEKLYHSAAPKLLKILEEPPSKSLIILIAENGELLLNTIISRSQLVKFRKLPTDVLQEALIRLHGANSDDALNSAVQSDGNYIEACTLLENADGMNFCFDFLVKWFRTCWTTKMLDILELTNEFEKLGRERQKAFLISTLDILRACIMSETNNTILVKMPKEKLEFVGKFAKIMDIENSMQFISEFNDAIYHIERNANPKILFTDLTFKMLIMMNKKKK